MVSLLCSRNNAREIRYLGFGGKRFPKGTFVQSKSTSSSKLFRYSLIEKNVKLDEALDMIERAVKESPDSGYIVDSLGWGYYKLGQYEKAVPN